MKALLLVLVALPGFTTYAESADAVDYAVTLHVLPDPESVLAVREIERLAWETGTGYFELMPTGRRLVANLSVAGRDEVERMAAVQFVVERAIGHLRCDPGLESLAP